MRLERSPRSAQPLFEVTLLYRESSRADVASHEREGEGEGVQGHKITFSNPGKVIKRLARDFKKNNVVFA